MQKLYVLEHVATKSSITRTQFINQLVITLFYLPVLQFIPRSLVQAVILPLAVKLHCSL